MSYASRDITTRAGGSSPTCLSCGKVVTTRVGCGRVTGNQRGDAPALYVETDEGIMATVLDEDELSIGSLRDLFVSAFFKAEIDSDGEIYITEGLDFPIWLSIDEEQRLIRMFTFV